MNGKLTVKLDLLVNLHRWWNLFSFVIMWRFAFPRFYSFLLLKPLIIFFTWLKKAIIMLSFVLACWNRDLKRLSHYTAIICLVFPNLTRNSEKGAWFLFMFLPLSSWNWETKKLKLNEYLLVRKVNKICQC